MYKYDQYDHKILQERVEQFSGQVARRLSGELSEEEFLPLRLQNGLYMQRHAYMLRVAIPYGQLNSTQLHTLAHIARTYDKDYGHFTTRQNIQYNWMELEKVPSVLSDLAKVEMHAIQTSGNCIRNITTDPFAGVAADEYVDTRVLSEIMRQWSTFHPEFTHLPRKFKIAISAAKEDRAAVRVHDIGLHLFKNEADQLRVRVLVGGGLGRTPIIGQVITEDLEWQHLLTYLQAIVRVYNLHGRRDNKYKARIKILVKAIGIEEFAKQVNEEWQFIKDGPSTITKEEFDRVSAFFAPPAYESDASDIEQVNALRQSDATFDKWMKRNTHAHKVPGYISVVLSTKPGGITPPGDVTSAQMDKIADLAEQYSFGELRITHEQNVVFADVRIKDLTALYHELRAAKLATANIGLITDIIACPGGDFCSLANAKSIPIALAIQERFDQLDYVHDLGDLSLNISGCINACGHHHIGNIGILGVDKNDEEWYQITIGGSQGNEAGIGKIIGPSFYAEDVPNVISKLIDVYTESRFDGEHFLETLKRIGHDPFKHRVYNADSANA